MAKAKQEKIGGVCPEGRLSFPNLFAPRERNGRKSWDCVIVWPEGTDLKIIEAQIKLVAERMFGAGALNKKGFKHPIKRFVDDPEAAERYGYPAGCSWASFGTKVPPPPVVFDKKTGSQIHEDDDGAIIYSGCWVAAKYDVYAYDNETKGVNLGLTSICKLRDDDRFAGRTVSAADEAREFGIDPQAAGINTDAIDEVYASSEEVSWAD